MIQYGIVGVGGFAATWLRSLQRLEQEGIARLAAAVVRNPAKYERQVTELRAHGCTIYPSLEAMLDGEQGRADVIGVPTGTAYHASMGVAAMRAGYPVLIEKPVAATVQDVALLRRAEAETGQWCAVGYQWIYSSTIQWLRERLRSGALGAVREAKTLIGWPRTTTYYGRNPWAGRLRYDGAWVLDGPATNATAHYLTNLLYLCTAADPAAATIRQVRAELYRAKPIESYDTSAILVHLATGAKALHLVSHALQEQYDPIMDLVTDDAAIHWEANSTQATIQYRDGRVESHQDADPAGNHANALRCTALVAAGEAPRPLCGLDEGAPHVLAIDLAFESAAGIGDISAGARDVPQADGSTLTAVEGMGATLRQAYQAAGTFADIGTPWAAATSPVDAAGYDAFPRNPDLPRKLGL